MDERDRAAHVAEPPFVAETLAWCNQRRAEDGNAPLVALPLGKRNDGDSCPCGAATGWFVGAEGTAWRPDEGEDDEQRIDLPDAVCQFVDAFDDGNLPQYDEAVAAWQPAAPAGASSPPGTAPESAGQEQTGARDRKADA